MRRAAATGGDLEHADEIYGLGLAERVVENLTGLFAQHHQIGCLRQRHGIIACAGRANEGLVLQGWR